MTTFEEETEPITFTTLGGPAPDPKWKYVDKAGHEHRTYAEAPEYPTLRWVVDETYWCERCRDEHENGHWECFACGETIEPGTISKGPETITRPGLRTRKIDGVVVSDEVWEKALRIQREGQRDVENRIVDLVAREGEG